MKTLMSPPNNLIDKLVVLVYLRGGHKRLKITHPICSMYGIFTYIWPKFMIHVGKDSIHLSIYGNPHVCFFIVFHQIYFRLNLGEDHIIYIHLDGGFIDFFRDFLAPKNSGEMIQLATAKLKLLSTSNLTKWWDFEGRGTVPRDSWWFFGFMIYSLTPLDPPSTTWKSLSKISNETLMEIVLNQKPNLQIVH